MKLNLRRVLPLLVGIAVCYSACKKSDNKPATSGPSNDAVSTAIATNLAQSLAGAYGGASVKDGVGGSATLTNSSSKLKTQSTSCGFFTDNNINYSYKQGDSVAFATAGSVNYYFLCNGNKTVGYDLADSLVTAGKGPGYDFAYLVIQNYHVKGLNLNNSNFTLNGKLKSWADFNYTKQPKSSSFVHNVYTFTDLYVHADDNFDISSGSATVNSKGDGTNGSWDITAYITFLGNHKAKLTFVNQVYTIDLLTGKTTPVK